MHDKFSMMQDNFPESSYACSDQRENKQGLFHCWLHKVLIIDNNHWMFAEECYNVP